MATYHCRVKVGGKGKASGHAAYIAREGRYAERAGYEDLWKRPDLDPAQRQALVLDFIRQEVGERHGDPQSGRGAGGRGTTARSPHVLGESEARLKELTPARRQDRVRGLRRAFMRPCS